VSNLEKLGGISELSKILPTNCEPGFSGVVSHTKKHRKHEEKGK